MILPAQSIRKACTIYPEGAKPLITPFVERSKHDCGMSYGLSSAGYDVRIAQSVTLRPGEFKLVSTLERFWMPHDLVAQVCDKSTWARMGVAVQCTIIEPGWEGFLTIELSNHGIATHIIEEGTPIAQILWTLLLEPSEQPYTGKYQNQENQPVPARLER